MGAEIPVELADEYLRRINDAYDVLSSAAAREQYDTKREDIVEKLRWKNEVRVRAGCFFVGWPGLRPPVARGVGQCELQWGYHGSSIRWYVVCVVSRGTGFHFVFPCCTQMLRSGSRCFARMRNSGREPPFVAPSIGMCARSRPRCLVGARHALRAVFQ